MTLGLNRSGQQVQQGVVHETRGGHSDADLRDPERAVGCPASPAASIRGVCRALRGIAATILRRPWQTRASDNPCASPRHTLRLVQRLRTNSGACRRPVRMFVVPRAALPGAANARSERHTDRPYRSVNSGGVRERTPGRRTPDGITAPARAAIAHHHHADPIPPGASAWQHCEGDSCMPPALRKRPIRLACAAATSSPAPSCPGPEHTTPASVSHRPRPISGSGR